ncbi:MAG: 50S ribosomal protein L24 [Mycoplasmataceae bacterium RC_NB112A]|nr:MAG: 50S ribosomal protein L24 [Mycoplasmataceae bacterium RC_NB112A]
MIKILKKTLYPAKTKLKVGDAVKIIAGQWRGNLDHIYQIDHQQGKVYLEKTGLRSRFDRFAPENKEGKKTREIRRVFDISNVAYYSSEHKKITKIGFQKLKKAKQAKVDGAKIDNEDSPREKGKTTQEVKVRVARKFKRKLID